MNRIISSASFELTEDRASSIIKKSGLRIKARKTPILDFSPPDKFLWSTSSSAKEKENNFIALVKKTLSIPKWANDKGTRLGINFSKVLTESILKM